MDAGTLSESHVPDRGRQFRLLHLSDTHVGRLGTDEDGVQALEALHGLLADVAHVPDLDLVLVTGDIADDGSEQGCTMVRDAVGRFALERGIPHVYTTGNHDRRPEFAAALGSGHLSASGEDVASRAFDSDERAAVSLVDGLRVVTLDSLVPGHAHGVLSEPQLDWLAEELRTPADDGTVLALHHPPIQLRHTPMQNDVLRNIDDLAGVLAGSDVRAVLSGHLHLQSAASLAGTPVWVTPGVVTRIDLTSPPSLVRGVLGAAATVVDLGGSFSPTFTVLQARNPRAGELVYLIDHGTGADVDPADEYAATVGERT